MQTECFTEDAIRRVFTIESFQKDRETFLQTHYPLSFAYKPAGSGAVERQMMEESLLDLYHRNLKERRHVGDFIRTFVIWGAPGTGKTELCRWIELTLKERFPEYEPIRVAKRDLAMYGILGVAQNLSPRPLDMDHLLLASSEDQTTESLFKELLKVIARLGNITIVHPDREEAYGVMARQIERNIRRRKEVVDQAEDLSTIETTLQFFTTQDKREQNTYGIKMDIPTVNRLLYKKLTSLFTDVNDVKELIFDYIKARNKLGKIPVLIFDDVTHLGDSVDDFISVITDISGSKEQYVCDFIIGTTTEFFYSKFQDKRYQTAQERIAEIRLSPGDVGEKQHANWLLGEDGPNHFLHFAHRYVSVARADGYPSSSPFASGEFDYYPFTPEFLGNLYARIQRELRHPGQRQIRMSLTPRYLIQVLKSVLLEFVQSGDAPSEAIDRTLTLDTLNFFDNPQQEKEQFGRQFRAIYWYGTQRNDEIALPRSTLTALDIPAVLPRQYAVAEEIRIRLDGRPVIQAKGPQPPPEPTPPAPGPKDPGDPELRNTIHLWATGQEAALPIETIEKGFTEALRCLTALFPGDVSFTSMVNRRSSHAGPHIEYIPYGNRLVDFSIGSFSAENRFYSLVSEDQAEVIHRRAGSSHRSHLMLSLNEDDFFRLYKAGHRKGEPEGLRYLTEFIQSRGDDVYEAEVHQHALVRQRLEDQLRTPLDAYVLAAFLMVSRCFKTDALFGDAGSVEEILRLLDAPVTIEIVNWPDSLKRIVPKSLTGTELMVLVTGLFHSAFSLRGEGTVIDTCALEEAVAEVQRAGGPAAVLKTAMAIDDRYRIVNGSLKPAFNGLVGTLKEFVVLAERERDRMQVSRVEGLMAMLSELDQASALQDQLEALRPMLAAGFKHHENPVADAISRLSRVPAHKALVATLRQLKLKLSDVGDPPTPLDHEMFFAIVNGIQHSEPLAVVQVIQRLLRGIEDEMHRAVEYSLSELTDQVNEFVRIAEVG